MSVLVAFLLTGLSSILLALAMDRHHRALFGRAPTATNKRKARVLGGTLLAAGLIWAAAFETVGVGFVEWMIIVGLASTLTGFGLPMLKDARKK